ncbi:MAG: hypothetical protein VKK03_03010 [Synechococcus sp.]|nr:hypothetical protein [Synechococcus sp.]
MGDNRPFDALRLTLMQDVLPVGLAMVERVRRGGAAKVVESFTTSSDPLADLREEGASAAESVREHLDQVSPGLGNPVIQVDVDVEPMAATAANTTTSDEDESLTVVLARIESRLELLQQQLEP